MLQINMEKKQNRYDVFLKGELDMSTERLLDEAINKEDLLDVNKICFNLTQLTFIDSTGIGKLIKYYRYYLKNNIDVQIENKNPDIEEVLELIGLRQIMMEKSIE